MKLSIFQLIMLTVALSTPILSRGAGADQLLHRLEALPPRGASIGKVMPIVRELVELRPARSLRYLQIGESRLVKTTLTASWLSLVILVEREVRVSALPEEQKRLTIRVIDRYTSRLQPRYTSHPPN